MQLCTADVRIEDSPIHVVPKTDLTPAEILVLRQIHGENAVVNVRLTGSTGITHQDEFERLKRVYGAAGSMSADQKPGVVLDQMFPGAIKQLPLTLSAIGIEAAAEAPPAPAPAPIEEHVDEQQEIEPEPEAGSGEGGEAREPAEAGPVEGGAPPVSSFPGWGGAPA